MKNIFKSFFFEERHTLLILDPKGDLPGYIKMNFSASYKYIAVSNIKKALEIIENRSLSLIIADISFSKTDGFKLCEKIKSNINTCHIPVVFLSAKNCVEQMIQGYELGADDFITKPFDNNLLLVQINRLIQNRALIKEKYRAQSFIVETREKNISKDEKFISIVRKVLEDNLSDPDFNVTSLSAKLRISNTQLYRILKDSTGYTPVEFIRIVRLQNAFKMLNQNKTNVTAVCYHSGFNNVSYFIKCFKDLFGVTPGYFRSKISNDVYVEMM